MTGAVAVHGLALLLTISGASAASWQVQDWRYAGHIEQLRRLHANTLAEQARAAAAVQRTSHERRMALEQQLKAQDDLHYRELANAQTSQARLRDRLATADVRLSVLVDTTRQHCSDVPPTASARELVHAAPRAELDPAHAQRIIGITDDGDRGLRALAACQAHIRAVSARFCTKSRCG